MEQRILRSSADGSVARVDDLPPGSGDDPGRWVWIDIVAGPDDVDELVALAGELRLDALAVRDSVEDDDLPKIDDFGDSIAVVLHGLADDTFDTYEVDCFITEGYLVTLHRRSSPSIDVFFDAVQRRPELAAGGVDDLFARLADVSTRRLLSVLDVFDDRIEGLVADALAAGPNVIADVTAVRRDLATIRRAAQPQREVFDLLRSTTSPLIGHASRRRFSDVFDVATRATHGIEAARTALAETLDAYRGAEAREATEVTKVLTVYAAIMLPLTLVVGFFGMNFPNLPGGDSESAWVVVSIVMGVVTLVSLGMFVALGWIRRPSGRKAGSALGRGLIEAARAPVELFGAVVEMSTMPLRTVSSRLPSSRPAPGDDTAS